MMLGSQWAEAVTRRRHWADRAQEIDLCISTEVHSYKDLARYEIKHGIYAFGADPDIAFLKMAVCDNS